MRRASKLALESFGDDLTTPAQSTDVPTEFVAFCTYLGVELTEGQRAIAAAAYDGETRHPVVVIVSGRRAGKSYVLVALRLLHGMLVRDVSTCAPGQVPTALVIAPNETLRHEVLSYARGAVESHPGLRGLLVESKGGSFMLRRRDGALVRFAAGVATSGGYGARGRSLTDFAMDECAFFRDKSSRVNDEDIYRAAQPGVLPGGQTIVASTPWAQRGLLYDLWSRNRETPRDARVFHAPTLTLRPQAADVVARETARDPENARREFGAEFMSGGTLAFFDPQLLEAAVDDALVLPRTALPGEEVAAGGDFGFRSDSSALAVVHKVGRDLLLGDLVELRPTQEKPLKPSETVREFAATLRTHGASYLMADGHYREAIVEHLTDSGLAFADAPAAPAEAYVRARTLLRERRVRIPRHPRLLQQLLEVEGRPIPGGGMSILHPRWRSGGHGDLAAAFVLALYQLAGEEVKPEPPKLGTDAWEEQERSKRRAELKARQDRPWFRGGRRQV